MTHVNFTTHVSFNEEQKTFRLKSGCSIYAFALTPELSLEHLYWGEDLGDESFDIRYLSMSSRLTHFNTYEAWTDRIQRKLSDTPDVLNWQPETMEEIQHMWTLTSKDDTCIGYFPRGDSEIESIRVKNIQRRMMYKLETRREYLGTKSVNITRRQSSDDEYESYRIFDRSATAQLGKGTLCMEYSDSGTGDFRTSAFCVKSADSCTIAPLRYVKHRIYKGKIPMPETMPCVRCTSDDDASTLVITMADVSSGLEVDLVYTAMHHYDAITRRVVFRNVPKLASRKSALQGPIMINCAHSFLVDFESTVDDFYLVQLSGSWGRERNIVETKLTHGSLCFGSCRGVSSHQHNPFAIITVGPPNETKVGETRAFSLIYSGNFIIESEIDEMGRLRIVGGIHPMDFSWQLNSGSEFYTPEAILVRSNEGVGGVSRTMHRLISHQLIPNTWASASPPILLNSWEALYFNVNHYNILELAKQGVRLGIDLMVLDDGWFGNRDDDTCALGDWNVNTIKFPLGLNKLVEEINSLGVKFGLWVEPEMVSENSELYKLHPDWCLHVPGRPRQIGRNQLVLDFSRSTVRNYIFDQLCEVLSSANIEYVKWDMNRPLTEVYSIHDAEGNPTQSETSHRYVLGLYEVLSRVTKRFPNILLETCASGGGRFDPGMLFFGPQIWTSDNTDALARMKIQFGTSLAYPAICVGAHISAVPNHITGNSSRFRTRSFVAMSGTFGFELDICKLTIAEIALYREHTMLYRSISHIIRHGDLYRLWNPFKVKFAAWMYVSEDKREGVVFAFSLNSDHWSNIVPRLHLQGLLPTAEYELSEPLPNNMMQQKENLRIIETETPVYQLEYAKVILTGAILMKAGLPIKFYTLDDSVMFILKQVVLKSRKRSVSKDEQDVSRDELEQQHA